MDTELLARLLRLASDGTGTQRRRRAKGDNPARYESYDPESYPLDQIRNRDVRDAMFMLLSMILDLNRKLEYFRLAAETIQPTIVPTEATDAEEQLAAKVAAHFELLGEEDVRRLDIDWETKAWKGWQILYHELYLPHEQDRVQLIRQVAEKSHTDAVEVLSDEIRERLGF